MKDNGKKEVSLGSAFGMIIKTLVSPEDYKKALDLKLEDTALENAILKQELDQANSKIEKIRKWFEEHQNQTINLDGMIVKETHIYNDILSIIGEE